MSNPTYPEAATPNVIHATNASTSEQRGGFGGFIRRIAGFSQEPTPQPAVETNSTGFGAALESGRQSLGTPDQQDLLTRRELLKRSAIATGLAVTQLIGTPGVAEASPPTSLPSNDQKDDAGSTGSQNGLTSEAPKTMEPTQVPDQTDERGDSRVEGTEVDTKQEIKILQNPEGEVIREYPVKTTKMNGESKEDNTQDGSRARLIKLKNGKYAYEIRIDINRLKQSAITGAKLAYVGGTNIYESSFTEQKEEIDIHLSRLLEIINNENDPSSRGAKPFVIYLADQGAIDGEFANVFNLDKAQILYPEGLKGADSIGFLIQAPTRTNLVLQSDGNYQTQEDNSPITEIYFPYPPGWGKGK